MKLGICHKYGDWTIVYQGFLGVLDPQNGDRIDYTKAIPCHAGLGWELANTARDRDFEKRMNLTGTFFYVTRETLDGSFDT